MRSLEKLEEEAKADLVAGRIIKCLWANDLEWFSDVFWASRRRATIPKWRLSASLFAFKLEWSL
jgi:hypothetical protein